MTELELTEPIIENVSPYDISYPAVLLSNELKTELSHAQTIVKEIYQTVISEMPIAAQMQQALQKNCRYVVDISDGTMQAIEKGILKLTESNGKTYAQLLENGRYGAKLPIKKEILTKGIDAAQVANALQLQAIQNQLEEVTNQLFLLDGNVRAILQGQQTDRIGLYYSGLSLFLESKNTTNDGLKAALQAQALSKLAEATFQLKLTMQTHMQFLEKREYNKARRNKKELIIEHMNSINQSFAFIHQATMLRAGIYCSAGEHAAMAQVFEEYAYFIDNDIAKNATILTQHDLNDNGTAQGLWAKRSRFKLDVAEFKKSITEKPKTLYLTVQQEETE